MTEPGPATEFAPARQPWGPPRLLSLDVFRGLTIAAMIVVNNPGAWGGTTQYGALRHAAWHGCTPTDLVFPFFLFIVGMAIPYSIGGRVDLRRPVAGRILRRGAVLFGLGLLLHAFPRFDFGSIRIPGVLQRIAAVYLATALLQWKTDWRAQAAAAAVLL
ncbi:MAG: heparan-alpha-glucosaminide N-acetyltransferase domain-containing protein, partial [Planctomycetota bacterium]